MSIGNSTKCAECQLAATLDVLEELFRHNEPGAARRGAVAWMFFVVFQVVGIVKGNLLICGDGPERHNPDRASFETGLSVWGTAMVNEARQVFRTAAVEIFGVTESKNELIAGFASTQRFGFRDALALILKDSIPSG